MWVEQLADRIEALKPMLGEGVENGTPCRFAPGQESGDSGGIQAFVLRDAGDGVLEIVDRRQQVASEARRRILNGFIPVPSRLSANVLLLGKRAQMTILRRRQLCAKRAVLGDRVFDYTAGKYLIVGIELPIVANVVQASVEEPCLGLVCP
jgi:hypothetical protein